MWSYDTFANPLPLSDAVEILGVTSCVFGMAVFVVHWTMVWAIPSFKLQSQQTRLHSAKNLTKSLALACYTPLAFKIIKSFLTDGSMDETDIRVAGTLYGCTDVAGLFIVPRLKNTTKFHHITVAGMTLYNLMFSIDGIWRGFVIYGAFCAFTFIVNTTIALKWFLKLSTLRNFCVASWIVYASASAVNWVCQLHFVRNHFEADLQSWLCVTLMTVIVVDDVVLLRWLANVCRPKTNTNCK